MQNPVKNSRDMLAFLNMQGGTVSDNELKDLGGGCNEHSQKAVDYKHDPKLQMRKDTKEMLQKFFRPFNTLLAQWLSTPTSTLISTYW